MRQLSSYFLLFGSFANLAFAQFRPYAVEGNLVFALDSVYAVPPAGWFAGHAPIYKKRFYTGGHGWGSQIMDDRDPVAAPDPANLGLSDLLESGKDLVSMDDKWKVPPSRSRVFSMKGDTINRPRIYLMLDPTTTKESGHDKMISVTTEPSGSKVAEVTELPPLAMLEKILKKQLSDPDQESNVKQLGRDKEEKELQSLNKNDFKLFKLRTDVRDELNELSRRGTFTKSLDPFVQWLLNHETAFVPLTYDEIIDEAQVTPAVTASADPAEPSKGSGLSVQQRRHQQLRARASAHAPAMEILDLATTELGAKPRYPHLTLDAAKAALAKEREHELPH